MNPMIIASRESPLALWQAEHVRGRLQALWPQERFEILGMTTRGDQILDRALSKVGGKGLFVKELEAALLDGRAQIAVHSLKDVPMDLAPEFQLAAIAERDDPRDCVVSLRCRALAELPDGARVGTSSLRRELLLRSHYPRLQVVSVRGNVGTRLAKLERGEFDALLMAAAGLKRLGLAERISEILPTAQFLPAPGQGALAIEVITRAPEGARRVEALDHPATRAATAAERAVSRRLGGNCDVPLAAYAEVVGDELVLRACVGDHRTGENVVAHGRARWAEGDALAADVVAQLKSAGALRLLRTSAR